MTGGTTECLHLSDFYILKKSIENLNDHLPRYVRCRKILAKKLGWIFKNGIFRFLKKSVPLVGRHGFQIRHENHLDVLESGIKSSLVNLRFLPKGFSLFVRPQDHDSLIAFNQLSFFWL